MKSILDKISVKTSKELASNIITVYNEQGSCVVNFIYFAQLVSFHVFSAPKKRTDKEKEYKNYKRQENIY